MLASWVLLTSLCLQFFFFYVFKSTAKWSGKHRKVSYAQNRQVRNPLPTGVFLYWTSLSPRVLVNLESTAGIAQMYDSTYPPLLVLYAIVLVP